MKLSSTVLLTTITSILVVGGITGTIVEKHIEREHKLQNDFNVAMKNYQAWDKMYNDVQLNIEQAYYHLPHNLQNDNLTIQQIQEYGSTISKYSSKAQVDMVKYDQYQHNFDQAVLNYEMMMGTTYSVTNKQRYRGEILDSININMIIVSSQQHTIVDNLKSFYVTLDLPDESDPTQDPIMMSVTTREMEMDGMFRDILKS